MDNLFQNFEGDEHHPPQEQFLLYVDGELAPKETARWQAHLDACWSCRVRVAKIEETIKEIIEFEDTVSRFQASQSSQNWGNFDSHLNALVQEVGKKSVKSKFFDFWRQTQHFWAFNWAGKLAASSLAVFLIFAIVYQFVFVAPVSASELLEKATAARQEQLQTTNQPVVYQKLKVSTQDKSAVIEVWNEIATAKNKKSADTQIDVLQEYETTIERNGFDALKPLSSESYQSWSNRLTNKNERVTKTKLADGADAFELTTIIDEPRSVGEVTEANLTVRESDWHTVSQSIQVKTGDGGDKIFEVSELEFQVVSRDTLAKNFFGEDAAPTKEIVLNTEPSPNASPNVSPSASASPEIVAETNTNTKTVSLPNAPPVSADLEVEVLNLLNQAKADLGEQITVTRKDGLLYVRGIVETPQRKNEILSALGSVKNNPLVRVEINTVAEAIAKEKNKPQTPVKTESIETQNSRVAAENDLIEHFGSAEAARAFAGQTVNRSGRAMSRAYALKRLSGQFKAEELRELSPAARAKWLALINSHARAFREETEALRRELQEVFSARDVAASETPDVKNIADVPRAVEALLGLASANDRVVRSAMAVSAGDTQFTAIKTAQFWQSLKSAEALAAKLQTIK